MSFEQLNISFVHSLAKIDPTEWDNCNAENNPFVSHAFLSALEASESVGEQTGWLPYHMVIRDSDNASFPILACMPLYLKSHSYGEYVFDHGWADAYERAGGKYYPKFQSCVPFTPATGPRLMVSSTVTLSEQKTLLQSALLDGLKQITERHNLSSAHLTFLSEAESRIAEQTGFLVRHDQQFHWQNNDYTSFDHFLGQLSSRKRKQIRKERRTVADSDITIEALTGSLIQEHHWDAFFEFYIDTGARKWGQPYLTRGFFSEISIKMPEKVVLFMCSREGRYIAGALNFISEETIYGRQWGCIEDHPCLHFETCYYRAIEYAIANKLISVEAGAQGPHKLARGYAPVRTFSCHYTPNEGFHSAVAHFLEQERAGVASEIEYLGRRTPFKKDS